MLSDKLLQAIDARIAKRLTSRTAMGEVVTLNPVNVAFDGSKVGVPVKAPAHLNLSPGDRVCLNKYYSDWYVIAAPGAGPHNEDGRSINFVTGGTTNITSYMDMPEAATWQMSWVKNQSEDVTFVHVDYAFGMWADGFTPPAAVTVEVALNFTSDDGITMADLILRRFTFNTSTKHEIVGGVRRINGIKDARYIVTPRWRRVDASGTGVLHIDSNDWSDYWVREVRYPGSGSTETGAPGET